MQADWPVRKAGRHRVSIAIEGDQAPSRGLKANRERATHRRDAFAQFDKAIESGG